jgi:hypothetical protein
VVTADAAHVAAVAEAMAKRHGYTVGTFPVYGEQSLWANATVAVETLTPLIRAQVAAEIRAEIRAETSPFDIGLKAAARIAEATP